MGIFDDDDISGEEIIGQLQEIVGQSYDAGAIGAGLDGASRMLMVGDVQGAAGQLQALANRMHEIRQVDPNAVAVMNRQPNRRRYWHAPFPATAVAAAAVGNLQMAPQELFRPERIFINAQLAGDYNVTAILVGQKNQLLTAGEINCSVFSEVAVRSFLNLDTANIGNTITLSLRNDGVAQTTPRPDFLGTVAV